MEEYCYRYPRPAVTADCAVFAEKDGRLHLLLIRRGAQPFKDCWALPGGFLNPDETAEEGAARELREETGIAPGGLRQLGAYTAPGRDPRGWVITVAFTCRAEMSAAKGGDDAREARWFPVDELPPLAFDHADIIRDALADIGHKTGVPGQ